MCLPPAGFGPEFSSQCWPLPSGLHSRVPGLDKRTLPSGWPVTRTPLPNLWYQVLRPFAGSVY